MLPFRCWRPSSRFRSRSRFFFCFFLDGISLSLPPLERLTAMLATLSANKERMAGCMKLPRGEGGSGRGGDEPSAGLDRVLKKRGLSRKRAQEKKCKREKAFRLPKLFSSTKTESRNSRLPTCGEEQVEGKNLFRGGSRSSYFFLLHFFLCLLYKRKTQNLISTRCSCCCHRNAPASQASPERKEKTSQTPSGTGKQVD